MFEYTENVCVICRLDCAINTDTQITLSPKGVETLKQFCSLRGDRELTEYLLQNPSIVNVHVVCRKNYTNKRRYEQENRQGEGLKDSVFEVPFKSLRSSVIFDWKRDCFICGHTVSSDGRHPYRSETSSSIQTLPVRDNILAICQKRNDAWALQVEARINMCVDLVAAEAIYHRYCYRAFIQFRTPLSESNHQVNDSSNIRGRPEDSDLFDAFEQMCERLEAADDHLYTLDELSQLMMETDTDNASSYSVRHMQRKLVDKYGEHIFFAAVCGKKNVICFRDMASRVINDKWYSDRRSSLDDESYRIVVAAARLVKDQIREATYNNNYYPKTNDFTNVHNARQWVPDLLEAFMNIVVSNDLKQVSLSHCIVQAARPRSAISPILFGVGVSLDHAYGSSRLLDMMARLGFSLSHEEINRYKQSVVQQDSDALPQSYPDSFTQWSGDNVDHNVNTLDGMGSFHGMGIISMSTPSETLSAGHFYEEAIPRLKRLKVASIIKNKSIDITYYPAPEKRALSQIYLKPVLHLFYPYVLPPSVNLDIIWHAGCFIQDENKPRPSWFGFMQDVCLSTGSFSPADIRMLPIIDMNPNDMSCIYSTLLFIVPQSNKLNIETACVTFDQPLWLKAVEIVQSSCMNIVCRLGGFHIIMNFLGSIGMVMGGSGLNEALQFIM